MTVFFTTPHATDMLFNAAKHTAAWRILLYN